MDSFEKRYYLERRGMGGAKWDGLEQMFGNAELLPFWVADMDFSIPDCVKEALTERVRRGDFGYTMPPPEYYEAFIRWESQRHGYKTEREWIRFVPGVVSGIYNLINAFTEINDAVIILSPCYYPFMNAVKDCGRRLICSMLKEDKGRYTIDERDFEEKVSAEEVKLFVLCSPHNPVGRVWTAEELRKLIRICRKYNVLIISDEIHQDLLFNGAKHVPAASLPETDGLVITLTAASKTFNLAALSHSIAILPDEELRRRFDAYMKRLHISGDSLGYAAVRAAYEGGSEWLEGLLGVVRRNLEYLEGEFRTHLPKAVISPLEGTYLLWVDLKAYIEPGRVKEIIQDKCGLAVDYGTWFYETGKNEEDCHIRINLATKLDNIKVLTERMIKELKYPEEQDR